MSNHSIHLFEAKQLLYGPIYSLRLGEPKMLKIYIKANLAISFIRLCKSSPVLQYYLFRKKTVDSAYIEIIKGLTT